MVDRTGQTADFILRAKRDAKVTKAFISNTVKQMKVKALLLTIRSSWHLNNSAKTDHRNAMARTNVTLDLERFRSPALRFQGPS
ncbi:hypothetical protein [Paraburkholderia caffeinilytica]|uniref:hypothetical protein n=1 Tax=Paraburkholderia caffeinilytica TaxID=1761016 RepID=UPI003D9FCA8D